MHLPSHATRSEAHGGWVCRILRLVCYFSCYNKSPNRCYGVQMCHGKICKTQSPKPQRGERCLRAKQFDGENSWFVCNWQECTLMYMVASFIVFCAKQLRYFVWSGCWKRWSTWNFIKGPVSLLLGNIWQHGNVFTRLGRFFEFASLVQNCMRAPRRSRRVEKAENWGFTTIEYLQRGARKYTLFILKSFRTYFKRAGFLLCSCADARSCCWTC